jgi:hypothetical protein
MVANPPNAASSYVVRVIPFEGEWCVACRKGYYAIPLDKTAAIEWAKRLAAESEVCEVAVCGENETVIEVLKVELAEKPTAAGVVSIDRVRSVR